MPAVVAAAEDTTDVTADGKVDTEADATEVLERALELLGACASVDRAKRRAHKAESLVFRWSRAMSESPRRQTVIAHSVTCKNSEKHLFGAASPWDLALLATSNL